MVGALAANFHEGSRSEYLAHYVFASFGSAIPVPHQEDSGIDLYCTLTERVGQRLWPRAHYTVQVKSTSDPWIIDGIESVRWFVEHPLPLFLCVVDKSELVLRVYHTSPRFYLWSLSPLPTRTELLPEDGTIGVPIEWSEGHRFSLGAPIIRMGIAELHKSEEHRRFESTLRFWIDVDQRNLQRLDAGVYEFLVPTQYETNVDAAQKGWSTQSRINAPEIQVALRRLSVILSWVSNQLAARGDIAGAARGALLLRHLFPYDGGNCDPDFQAAQVTKIQQKLNQVLGDNTYVYAGVDELAHLLDERLKAP